MGFQFIHLESYSRKADKGGRTVDFVLNEAARAPSACTHIENPGVPEVVYGLDIHGVRELHDELVAAGGAVDKNGKRKKIRIDQHTLMTCVASHPGGTAEEVERWEALTVAWMREKYGDRLVSAIRHSDEGRPHLHFYIIPRTSTMKAKEMHPGVVAKVSVQTAAKAEGCDDKTANAKGDVAYKKAMRLFQDAYWEAVGIPCGLARLGPARRRLSRAEWKAEQHMVKTTSHLIAEANGVGAEVGILKQKAEEAKRAADTAVVLRTQAEMEAVKIVARARRQASLILATAKRQAEMMQQKYESVGGMLRGVIAGLWEGRPSAAEKVLIQKLEDAEHGRAVLLKERQALGAQVRDRDARLSDLSAEIRRVSTRNAPDSTTMNSARQQSRIP